MGYYLVLKMNEILPFAATGVDLQGIMLSEISQRNTNNVYCYLYVESIKLLNITKQRLTERTNYWLPKVRGGKG